MYLITGGNRGIGKALAIELADKNNKVVIIGRNEKLLKETAAINSNISYVIADVANDEDRLKIKDFINNNTLKALVNNAGIIGPILPITKIEKSEWQKTMATNLDPALFLTQLLIENLKNGKVLNIGSGAQYSPVYGWSAYCVSKAALAMLTKCFQLECSEVAFTCVLPGIIDTDMQVNIRNSRHMDEEKLIFFQKLYDNNQLLSTKTVAKFLSWLLISVEDNEFKLRQWDIYDNSHHKHWLVPPDCVPSFD